MTGAVPETITGRECRPGLPGPVALLSILLAATMLAALCMGAVWIRPVTVLRTLTRMEPFTPADRVILLQVRLPRICSAGLIGASLSIAGLLFQGLFRNPMADPYVTGSSGGAVLGAALGLILVPQLSLLGFGAVSLLAFAGSLAAIAIVYWIARVSSHSSVVPLLLAGFAVSSLLSYSTYFVQLLDQNYGAGTRILAAWLQGAVSSPQWSQLAVAAVLAGIAALASLPLTYLLNTLVLGEEYARQLGVDTRRTRLAILATGSLLAACAVSLGGLISFVGLIVPHVCRLLIGPDHVRLLPLVALAGAILLIVADTLARIVLAPTEVPVGVLMAFIGAPFFLYLLHRSRTQVFA